MARRTPSKRGAGPTRGSAAAHTAPRWPIRTAFVLPFPDRRRTARTALRASRPSPWPGAGETGRDQPARRRHQTRCARWFRALAAGGRIEVELFGRNGRTVPALMRGADSVRDQIFMRVTGYGRRISAPALLAAETRESLHMLLPRAAPTFLRQIGQTAVACAGAPGEERLACWLRMHHDRKEEDDISVIHEFLSIRVGVRRPQATVAIHALEGARLVPARCGRIRLLSRAQLGGRPVRLRACRGRVRAPDRPLARSAGRDQVGLSTTAGPASPHCFDPGETICGRLFFQAARGGDATFDARRRDV